MKNQRADRSVANEMLTWKHYIANLKNIYNLPLLKELKDLIKLEIFRRQRKGKDVLGVKPASASITEHNKHWN